MAANQHRRTAAHRLYTEPNEEEEEEEERGKKVQEGRFVYIVSMVVKQVTNQNVVYFRV